jgi:hypothetical protein
MGAIIGTAVIVPIGMLFGASRLVRASSDF